MRKRIAIHGATDETLRLVPLLAANPDVEVAVVYDADREAAARRARALGGELAEAVTALLRDDPAAITGVPDLYAVIDAGTAPSFAERFPDAVRGGVQVVAPLTARLLWGYGAPVRDHKAELLQALREVVDSVNLTIDADELFSRMLEMATSVTGADGGSLMLLDPQTRELRVRTAVGIEKELWPKIRLAVGEGIAGRVAADGRSRRLRGKADPQAFRLVRERLDVESALSVPLLHAGGVLGVLNLHHTRRPDAFSDEDLRFVEQVAELDARIIARAQEHEGLREQAERYAAVRETRAILGSADPLPRRLDALCRRLAAHVGGGIATLYLADDDRMLRLAGTSLAGGGFGGEYRLAVGAGLDGGAARERRPLVLHGSDGRLAYAALPLLAGERLLGVLSVQSGTGPHSEGELPERLAEVAAAAADTLAQLQREARIASRATKAGAINETGLRLISTTEPAEVVRLATSSAALVFEADHAVLRLQDDQTGRYVIRSYFGSGDGRLQERLFRLDQRVSVTVLKRRAPFWVREVAEEADLSGFAGDARSLVAAPLRVDGRPIGTLALYDKLAPDSFATAAFSEEDLELFERFVGYVEKAVANARFHVQVRRHHHFDQETDLPDGAYLERRIDEEIARATARDGCFGLVSCRLENLEAIEAEAPARARALVRCAAGALRGQLRGFDVLARAGPDLFVALLPDPQPDVPEAAAALARGVAEAVAEAEVEREGPRAALAFGYAAWPDDARSREALRAASAAPRIRLV